MTSVRCQISVSLDGFVAGPNQSPENPIGEGGMRLHEWAFATDSWRAQQGLPGGERSADSEVIDEVFQGVGAYIMGRKMFGGGAGPWDEAWAGWWGEDPPFHAPVFVLTHHPREPLSMQGGTTFTFVTNGIQSALEQARSEGRSVHDGIYALRSASLQGEAKNSTGHLTIRRIQYRLDGAMVVRCDNPRYPEEIYNLKTQKLPVLVGRVVWRGSRI